MGRSVDYGHSAAPDALVEDVGAELRTGEVEVIDFEDQRMRSALGRGDLPQVLDAGNTIRRHHEDPAFERYLERPNLPAPIARFN